jgi:myo-inositol-1(or 4)-monophosphatase
MESREIARRYTVAQDLAVQAGRQVLPRFRDPTRGWVERKGPQDWLSDADGEVEKAIIVGLSAAFPSDSVLAEESGGAPGEQLWVIDPIDGTANFVRGLNDWCVSIAFVAGGVAEFGVIYAAVPDELYAARRGHGAMRNGSAIRVSTCTDITDATIGLGFSYRTDIAAHSSQIQRLLEARCEYRRNGSGALSMAYVAEGRLDGYLELHINAWDVLAGLVLIREAGGWTNDFLAGEGLTRGNPIQATTPGIRDALAAAAGFTVDDD